MAGDEINAGKKKHGGNLVKKVYSIIRKRTRKGGNCSGGEINGETTVGSFKKLVKLLKKCTQFMHESRFLDVGSGLKKLSLHLSVDPRAKFTCGTENQVLRWTLSIMNHHNILKEVWPSDQHPTKESIIGNNCFFIHGDIREAFAFDPFTHVYMLDVGFLPTLFLQMSE
jgi:hypothetical protein